MSDENNPDALMEYLFSGGHSFPDLTVEAIQTWLKSNDLRCVEGRDNVWLTRAVRTALYACVPDVRGDKDRKGNAGIRTQLTRQAAKIRKAWLALNDTHDDTDTFVWDFAFRNWDGEGGKDCGNGIMIGEPLDYGRYANAVREMDWLAGFLDRAAAALEDQRKNWRLTAGYEWHVDCGHSLAAVYEHAFGEPPTVNNYPSADRAPTMFMHFYEVMMRLAFKENAVLNLADVLKDARQRHEEHPVSFRAGVIP